MIRLSKTKIFKIQENINYNSIITFYLWLFLIFWTAPNTNSISAYFWSVCWEKTLEPNTRVIISWLWGQYFHQTSPFLNWLKLGICVRKIHEISGNQIFVCFDFGCQAIFFEYFTRHFQTFASFHFFGAFLEKLSLWLKSKNINSVLLIPNLDQ